MPIQVTSPSLERKQLDMDIDDKKTGRYRQRNVKSRLQRKSSQATNSENHRLEEMSQWPDSLDRLLSSKLGTQIFEAFLKSEFSDENLEFWTVCEDYKKIKSSFRMSSRAKKIFKRYIQAEAPREINIDQKTRELIRWNLKVPSAECFDDAQKTVYRLMERDSYPRFLRSDIYRTLLDSASESEQM
ncbi:regulator of G-protein signaling 21-like [Odontesthes bonariensis]|uniref:regulator of G-protein signaling 21-like n=1 Tax=Odontesthes bonariensis TaxID=219752 RepID=UPI003F58FF4A